MRVLKKENTYRPKSQKYKKGDILVLKEEYFDEKLRDEKYQLFMTDGNGAGCSLDIRISGKAILGKFLIDDEFAQVGKSFVLGILNEDTLEEMAEKYEWLKKYRRGFKK